MNLKILILDDEKRVTEELSEYLVRKNFDAFTANRVEKAWEILHDNQIDVMILDLRLKNTSGLEILKKVKKDYPDLEVIMITGHGDMDTVIESMRLGAIDFLTKPFKHTDIKIAIERTGKFINMQQKLNRVQKRNSLISRELENNIERNLVGKSAAIKKVLKLSLEAAEYDVNVLLTGESGTGKEIIARIIHFASKRKDHNFFPVNCSAIPENLLESEFFGYKKGSFTGANRNKKGFFELTDGGTLFLDEIADMPPALQAKLLRVIEEKKIKRIGEEKEFPVDVRIVAATNHDIENMIKKKQFRLDLYHRLNTFEINIPPLRERTEDIEPLLKYFVNNFSQKSDLEKPKIDKNLINHLRKYDFPGNVRELKNLTERAMIICKNGILNEKCFPLITPSSNRKNPEKEDFDLQKNEKNLIKTALQKTEYNQTKAAKLLGISRHALIRRIDKYNIDK